MSLDVLKKNISIHARLLKRYGRFKSTVIRKMQLRLFSRSLSTFLSKNNILQVRLLKIMHLKKMYEYLYSTRDIWMHRNNKLSKIIKDKIFEMSQEEPDAFQDYLVRFEYVCPYIRRDKKICKKKVDTGGCCLTHTKCMDRLEKRIVSSIITLPLDICNIIFKYSHSISLIKYI